MRFFLGKLESGKPIWDVNDVNYFNKIEGVLTHGCLFG